METQPEFIDQQLNNLSDLLLKKDIAMKKIQDYQYSLDLIDEQISKLKKQIIKNYDQRNT